MISYIALIV